jgi:phage terminase large subunit-like protein
VGETSKLNWDLSCKDWQDRVKSGKSLVPILPLFEDDADRAEAIFNNLKLPDVIGQPRLKEAAGDWFRDCVRGLFGSYDEAKQERMIRELFLLVPKKNSKTSNGAALMVTAMLFSKRPRAEFLLVAPTQEVADLAFRQAVGMIEADPVLTAKCYIQDHIKKITYRPTGAFLKVKSFDPKVVTGSKPSGVLLDELHVIAESHDADRVIGQLRGGLVSQPEGFLVTITTQSERAPAGVFRAELLKARKVRDGELKAPILPVLYEFPANIDWRNPKNWHMVTPNNGRSVSVDRLIPDYEQAQAAGEEELRRWASQHLNIEIGLARIGGPVRSSGSNAVERLTVLMICSTDPRLSILGLTAVAWMTCLGLPF